MRAVPAAASLFMAAQCALAQYTLYELEPPPGGRDSIASGLDEQGRIVGSSQLTTGVRIAVVWESADAPGVPLGALPGGSGSEAVAAAGGLVVGLSDRDCPSRGAFLWTQAGGMVRIGPDTCESTIPIDLNVAGRVLMEVGEPGLPLVWDLGGGPPRTLETWGMPASVVGIDPAGRVLGASRHHPEGGGALRAIEWAPDGSARLLARLDPDAGGSDAALDRNASGEIAGFARLGSVTRGAVWDAAGRPIDAGAGLGPTVRSQLIAINDAGLAVGESARGAFAWTQAEGARLLIDLVDETGDGWSLAYASDVNEAGRVVGYGTSPSGALRGFVLVGGGLGCPADLDGDGVLTIFDFLAFQNLFDSGDPRADFDGDGSLTIFDFLAFQNAFDAGCP